MKQHPSDFALHELQDRVAPACGLSLPQVFELDFPPHEYSNESGRFWRAETVRTGVIAITRGELLARPDELRELAQMVRRLRSLGATHEISDAEAREAAIQHVIKGRFLKIFGLPTSGAR